MRPPRISDLLILAALLAGCTPTCEQVCRKLVECDGLSTTGMSWYECELSCRAQEDLYQRWEDAEKQDAFDEELRCLQESTCAAVADGACYDPTIWGFGDDAESAAE